MKESTMAEWAALRRSSSAAGPFDAWLAPRSELTWRPAPEPVTGPVAKLGGQPVWLDEPFWPVSATSGEPMTFAGQFPLPGPDVRLAYLFLTQDEECLAETFEFEGGENALLIQPGGRIPGFVTGIPRATGPSLWRRGAKWTDRVPVELLLDVREPDAAARVRFDREIAGQDAVRTGVHREEDDDAEADCRSYVGGRPLFWQPWTTVVDSAWRFFFQLDGAEGADGDDFALNFGGGTGYAFLSEDGREGRFFWDCV
ncbi:hypothetical protein [Actinoplanes friuliensis]|uniref:hypothetical protein n=1 Tax=Actinoplanes friuliensis TaxID=196914 RepID=UPI001EE66876|nr:hypothetical protein [Actinoplanes friuliensis]